MVNITIGIRNWSGRLNCHDDYINIIILHNNNHARREKKAYFISALLAVTFFV